MEKITPFVVLYVVAWFVFAIFDFNGLSDTIVGYELRPTIQPAPGFPKMMPSAKNKFRVSGQIVVRQIGDFDPTTYKDCSVYDKKNWACTYSDQSGQFGFHDGVYFSRALNPMSKEFQGYVGVSRFRYVWINVKWILASKSLLDKVMVLFVPFTI